MSIKKIRSSYLTFALLILVGWFIQSAQADYGSISYYDYDYDYSRSDRISREHRDAGDVDDWLERGNSTVTASPRFHDGIRLSAWESDYISDDEYDFALASAIYLFDIPRRAQYIEIKVRYSGEGREADFDDYEEIAGRAWIRNFKKEHRNRRYDDDDRETLYGDTFVLRAKRRSETIKIPAAHHVDEDGAMELHIVAENGGLLDVEYIDVSTYRHQPEIRVVNRYVRGYEWRPWHYYTYSYFYSGPIHYVTDYNYYVRWSYPVYDIHYVTIRKNYGVYLNRYYKRYPMRHHGYSGTNVNIHVYNRQRSEIPARRLTKWTNKYEQVRREYDRSRLMKKRKRTDVARVRNSVRTTIQNHRSQPVLSDRTIQSRAVRIKRRRPSASASQSSSSTRSQERIRIVRPTERSKDTTERTLRNRASRSTSTKSDTSNYKRAEIKKRRSSSSVSSSSPSRSSVKSDRSDSGETVQKRRSSSSSSEEDDEEEKKKQQSREKRTKRRR